MNTNATNLALLAAARDAWMAAEPLRRARQRCKRFTYGDQWSDPAPHGGTEAQQALASGRRPLTNNLIRQLVKTVVGRFRSEAAEKKSYDAPPGSPAARNELAELDSRMLEEFLISGCAIQRVVAERRVQGEGVWVDNVSPDHFFVNAFRDPRGFDIELAGMVHDFSPAELIARFAGRNRPRAAALRHIYGSLSQPAGGLAATDFMAPAATGKWRAIELWTLDAIEPRRVQDATRFLWQCRWLAPDGSLLASYPSPFGHGSHPFAVKFYPLTDGEVHSFVADLLDQQQCINRLITIIDHIMSCSAKGVLLFPTSQLPAGTSWKDVADTWAAADGIIPITGKGDLPTQVVTSGAQTSAYQLLSLQMKIFDDISGVGDALLGRATAGARAGEGLYEAQVRNATIALYDLLLSFESFTRQRDMKMKNC